MPVAPVTNVFGVIIDDLLVQGLHEMQPHLCAIGGLASKLARSGEGCPVLVDKCFERRRRPTTNRFDQVVRAGEDPVLVVDGCRDGWGSKSETCICANM